MTNLDLTHIYAVLDRSGSMQSIKTDTEGGFNAFMAEQAKQPGTCKVTLAQFDTDYDIVYQDILVTEVPPLELVPRGSTALLDAVGKTIVTAGESLAKLSEDDRPASVIFAILTDGHENASREYNWAQVKDMITTQRDQYSWLFKFFGADLDAVDVAANMGIAAQDAIHYTPQNVGSAFALVSNRSGLYRGARTEGQAYAAASSAAAFTDSDRDELTKTKGTS